MVGGSGATAGGRALVSGVPEAVPRSPPMCHLICSIHFHRPPAKESCFSLHAVVLENMRAFIIRQHVIRLAIALSDNGCGHAELPAAPSKQ